MSQPNDSDEGTPVIGVWIWLITVFTVVMGLLFLSDFSGLIMALMRHLR